MVFTPLGDSAVVVRLGVEANPDAGALAAVSKLAATLRSVALRGVRDVVPAYDTVTVFYEPARLVGDNDTPYAKICGALAAAMQRSSSLNDQKINATTAASRDREIPVCYGGENGPDLLEVAAHTGLTPDEVIARHCHAEYGVQAIGFAPGFPYLSGLPKELAMPRRATPRVNVPAGSVGLGGTQTGVYPRISPGGWRLIGRTPLKLFELEREEPAWLRVGDVVTFRAITPEEFASWR